MNDRFAVVAVMETELRTGPIDAAIASLASRQHGVVARWQLVRLGLSSAAIAHRVANGRLHRVHRGVYAVGHPRLTREGRWMAAVLAPGDGAVLSHRAAAALWGIRPSSGRPEVTLPRRGHASAGFTRHYSLIPLDEVTTERGIPVTTAARTLLDLAATLTSAAMRSALGQAEYRRLTDETGLQELIARYPRRPGSRVLRALACVPQEPTRSDFEDLFIEFLVGEHLPGPVVNATIELRDRSIEPDFVWHDHKLIVELDSYAAHGTRHGFEEDRARDRAAQLERWRVLRITWRQYTAHRNELAAQLRRALA